jgi:3-methyladenine DNA glycosylase AlkC
LVVSEESNFERSWKNPDEVARFIKKWTKENTDKNTKWIIKDGIKKLSSGEQKKILELLD